MGYSIFLVKEIEAFKQFTMNKYSGCEKRYIKKESTFKNITYKGIRFFLDYLAEYKSVDLKKVRSLHTYLIHFNDFVGFLMKKYNATSTFKTNSSFIYSLIHYFKTKLKLTKQDTNKLNEILEKYRKQKGIDMTESKRNKNKEERQQTDIKVVANGIKRLENSYKKTKSINGLKALVILKILFFLGWRTSNIMSLEIGKNIYKQKGKWFYRFTPEEQKSPLKVNGVLKDIEGIFPEVIQKDLELYIEITESTGLLFKNISSFYHYVMSITKKYIGIALNPHIFRSIVFNWLVENESERDAKLMLWHKPTELTSSDRHYFNHDINGSVLRANEKLMSLYGGRGSISNAVDSPPKSLIVTDTDEIKMIMFFRDAKKRFTRNLFKVQIKFFKLCKSKI